MRGFLLFLIGIVIGAAGYYYFKVRQPATAAATAESTPTHTETSRSTFDQARDAAISAKDAVGEKLQDWHLTGDDIKRDLQRGGEVVRTKAQAAGAKIASATSNARIVTSVKAKYALDKDLSARAIEVSCDAGVVTLRGSVATEALIGKAIALALDTDGVTQVKSSLVVQPHTGT